MELRLLEHQFQLALSSGGSFEVVERRARQHRSGSRLDPAADLEELATVTAPRVALGATHRTQLLRGELDLVLSP